MQKYEVVIIGSGPGGVSALIWCKRLGIHSLLLERSLVIGGQLHQIRNDIVDYPGLLLQHEDAPSGPKLAERLSWHMQSMGCTWETGVTVTSIHPAKNVLQTTNGPISFCYAIFATGSRDRRLGIPGEAEMINRGELYSTSGQLHLLKGKRVAIVGGGDRALEGALKVADVAASVLLIHHSDRFRARRDYLTSVKKNPIIQVIPFCEVARIRGEERVNAVDLSHIHSGQSETVEIDAVLIRIGVIPNSGLLEGIVELDNLGYVVTNRQGETSRSGIYAIGDLSTHPEFSSIANSMGQGMIAAKSISLSMYPGGARL